MQGPTPSPGYFEKLLVDDGAMELVGGDDQGQHTAVNDELHAELIIVRAKVGFHNFSQNRFVSCVFSSEHLESSSHISQARALQDDVVDVFEEFLTPAWLQKTDSILVGGPEPTESLTAITPSQEHCLDPGSLDLIRITIQGGEDWVGVRQREEAWLEVLERGESSSKGKFGMPVFLNLLLAHLLEFNFGDWVCK